MADFKPLPRNRVLGALSDYLSGARSLGDRVDLPLFGGLGSLLLGKSPEEVEAWAYGDYPMHMPAQGNLPQFKPERDMQILDTAGAVPFLNTSAKFFRGLPSAVSRAAQEFAEASFAGAPGVVKRKGGNWLPGSIQDMTNEIESPMWLSGEIIDEAGGPGTWASVVQRGGDNDLHPWMRANEPELYDKIRGPVNTAADAWLNKQLARYMQNEMGTPEDPIRALAERGVTHAPEVMGRYEYDPKISPSLAQRRYKAGFPAEGMAQSPLAKQWEIASDASIYEKTAGKLRREASDPSVEYARGEAQRILDENPWMSKLPDNEKLYGVVSGSEDLGFDHLMDELRNAMNPESGLPPELLLRPESLSRVSVPQAVERVAKINDWRAKQMELQRAARGPNPAEHLFKEYPEGYKWVQLKKPEFKAPEGYVYDERRGVWWNPDDEGAQPIKASSDLDSLREALKYEGDTMGHCVGGYCDDVAAGASNIFSLRDAKGQPHVTIETAPGSWKKQNLGDLPDPTGQYGSFSELVNARRSGNGDFDTVAEKLAKEYGLEGPPAKIVQIKGKQNRAPIADYLPFVQDFVKSQPWQEVGDLRNAGMLRFLQPLSVRIGPKPFEVSPGYYTRDDLVKMAQEQGGLDPKVAQIWAEGHGQGYAEGGHVDLRALADQAYREIQR